MTGNILIAEEYQRLIHEFALANGLHPEPRRAIDRSGDYDPLRLRSMSEIAPVLDRLMGASTDVPMAWRLGAHCAANCSDLLSARARSSATIGEALEVALDHQHILTNGRTISHRRAGNGKMAALHHAADNHEPATRFLFHAIMGTKLAILFAVFGGGERQHELCFQSHCFGALMRRLDSELDFLDLDFREGELIMGFDHNVLGHRMLGSDERIIAAFDRELRRRAAEVPTNGSLKDRIKYHIRRNHLSQVSVDEICDSVRIQRRTLARVLRNEGTSFTAILTELRREKALHLVGHTGIPLKRVAAELGFNSDASFNMAFKSWTGQTPMRFRKGSADMRQTMDDRRIAPTSAPPKSSCQIGGLKLPGPLGPRWESKHRKTVESYRPTDRIFQIENREF